MLLGAALQATAGVSPHEEWRAPLNDVRLDPSAKTACWPTMQVQKLLRRMRNVMFEAVTISHGIPMIIRTRLL
jgi:hypothetical protein